MNKGLVIDAGRLESQYITAASRQPNARLFLGKLARYASLPVGCWSTGTLRSLCGI